MQAFISLYSKKQDSNHLKLYTTYSPAHVEFENVFHFWSPNDMRVMCIYLQCSGHKQNHCHYELKPLSYMYSIIQKWLQS